MTYNHDRAMSRAEKMQKALDSVASTECGLRHEDDAACCIPESGVRSIAEEALATPTPPQQEKI